MKKLLTLALMLGGYFSVQAQHEKEAIEEVVLEAMVNGAYNLGVVRNMELGFSEHYTAYITDADGNVHTEGLQEWINQVKEQKSRGHFPLPEDEQVSVRYLRYDIAGNMAQVKLTFMVGNKPQHNEFLVLVHSPTGWLILSRYYLQETAEMR